MYYNPFQIFKHNGGFQKSIAKLFRFDSLKIGCLVGQDKYGNKYYENSYYFFGSNRWVEYSDHVNLNYDASQIPSEWFGWIHYRTDMPPDSECRPKYKWMLDHTENLSGTKEAYMPYTTTLSKIQAWHPNLSKKSSSFKGE